LRSSAGVREIEVHFVLAMAETGAVGVLAIDETGLTTPEYLWWSNMRPVGMIHPDDGFCFLTLVQGTLNNPQASVAAYINLRPGPNLPPRWELAGSLGSSGTVVHARARCLRYLVGPAQQ
jgi:hypothetical protein